jgi:hypothetical protein
MGEPKKIKNSTAVCITYTAPSRQSPATLPPAVTFWCCTSEPAGERCRRPCSSFALPERRRGNEDRRRTALRLASRGWAVRNQAALQILGAQYIEGGCSFTGPFAGERWVLAGQGKVWLCRYLNDMGIGMVVDGREGGREGAGEVCK